jgi:hypothetical protein
MSFEPHISGQTAAGLQQRILDAYSGSLVPVQPAVPASVPPPK